MNIEKESEHEYITRAIKGIKFGYVQLVIQDSKIVQIEKTEKIRFDPKTIGEGGSV